MIRYVAIIFLFLSGVGGYTIDKFGQDLCVNEYIAIGTITYFKELNGVSANDPSMLGMCGILSIIFSVILIFIKNKYFYTIFSVILLLAELILLNMMETVSYKEIIYDSITKCSNYSALAWIVFQTVFLVFSGFYLFKRK
ncbi:hypothetical protein [Acinetobacter haemolyticus]|uniref:Uncharacterized protein n=1 Tax=Acinetobacter haemolyticus TaxID=29430 RepID=A0A845PHZ4_ACIHA|nr:hypothetical protein [Acinetobacter haemolyticus]NAR57658.1 hypothetical protein [Acinetobacter haemolyticus]NAR89477.1 hypothetical protein [Acinetobacter haemolyticus]NAR95639.1 hypothetical protein [Acinetobacter haemolyticus]NAS09905.1 hypothetical protein [Acinetobacter haemolyticus]QHI08901.1 hypothetical protein AhaeAN59_01600 [Acinetobacter haemolyticus]